MYFLYRIALVCGSGFSLTNRKSISNVWMDFSMCGVFVLC